MTVKGRIIGFGGLLLSLCALGADALYPSQPELITGLAAGAVALLLWFGFHVLGFGSGRTRRSAYLRLNMVLMIVFFLFIITLLNLIVRQYYFRYDFSSTRKYSLAPQSRVVARNVDREIRLIYFGDESSKEFAEVGNLFESYRYLNRNILYEMHDLDRVPVLAEKYSVRDYNTVVVDNGETFISDKGSDEQTLTNILIRATKEKQAHVGYLTGHNEPALDDESRPGYSRIAERIESLGYILEEVNLLSSAGVPWKTDVLIIASPENPLAEEQNGMLDEYRKRGGKFLIMINSPEQLAPFLASIGIGVSKYPIYDERNLAGTGPSAPLVTKYYPGPVTRNFRLDTVYPGVYEVKLMTRDVRYKYETFARSSRTSWFEKNGDGIMQDDEEDGFQIIGGVLSNSEELMKAVIFGDSDFVSNAYVSVSGNANLFLNALHWLAGDGALTEVAPTPREFIPMYITAEQSRLIRLIPTGIPVVIILAGTAVWIRRRRL